MANKIVTRTIFDIVLVVCVIQGWWFLALPLGLFGVTIFPGYLEIAFAGLVYDWLFGISREFGWAAYIGTLISCAAFLLVTIFKNSVRK